MSAARPAFVATTTNGSGMGHLSRQVAVAAALADRTEPVVFSLSTALATVLAATAGTAVAGLRGEYCPSYHRHQMPVPDWHSYLRDRLVALVRETGAGAVGFDGVTPYLGLLRARALLPEVPFVWFRRGMWRPGANVRALRATPFFDLVIEPGDLAAAADRGATAGRADAVRVPPVSVLSATGLAERAAAAAALGLETDRPAVLVNLGAWAHRPGRAGGGWWTSVAAQVVRQLLSGTDWQVALTRAPILDDEALAAQTGRLHVLRDVYPLARYLGAFEAAVAEAGYNGFHELLLAGVPTLFLAKATTTDDQRARGRWAAGAGTALFADDAYRSSGQLARLLDAGVRDDLRTVCAQLPPADGAAVAADLVLRRLRPPPADGGRSRGGSDGSRSSGGGSVAPDEPRDPDGWTGSGVLAVREPVWRHRVSAAERRRIAVLESKAAVARVIGPAATDLIRSLRHGPAAAATGAPARRPPADPLLTTDLDPQALRAARPLEHLLPGSSAQYRLVRAAIAARYHRVPPGWPDGQAAPLSTTGRRHG